MNEFIYDDTAPYKVNFNRWCYANRVEREMYREPLLDENEARITFRKMYGFKRLNDSVFISGTNAMN